MGFDLLQLLEELLVGLLQLFEFLLVGRLGCRLGVVECGQMWFGLFWLWYWASLWRDCEQGLCGLLHRLLFDLNVCQEFLFQVAHPGLGEERLEGRVFQGFLYEGQSIKFQELAGLSEICAFGVEKLPETRDLLFGNCAVLGVLTEVWVNRVNQEVHFEIKLKFILFGEEVEYGEERLSMALIY